MYMLNEGGARGASVHARLNLLHSGQWRMTGTEGVAARVAPPCPRHVHLPGPAAVCTFALPSLQVIYDCDDDNELIIDGDEREYASRAGLGLCACGRKDNIFQPKPTPTTIPAFVLSTLPSRSAPPHPQTTGSRKRNCAKKTEGKWANNKRTAAVSNTVRKHEKHR